MPSFLYGGNLTYVLIISRPIESLVIALLLIMFLIFHLKIDNVKTELTKIKIRISCSVDIESENDFA